MTYTSISYYLLVAALMLVYYRLPKKHRWISLLCGSLLFYYIVEKSMTGFVLFMATILFSYLAGLLLDACRDLSLLLRRVLLWVCGAFSAAPLLLSKGSQLAGEFLLHRTDFSPVMTLGLSFYTLQILAYLGDIHAGRIRPRKNFFKYALFISFFPQIIQGPIPRYEQLGKQLFQGHPFREENVRRGFYLIIWGFFLKMMIADKAGIFVDEVFGHSDLYTGAYFLAAGILYSIQLYADFLSCVTLSQGVSFLFGIRLADNFHHPYFATSISDFWRRWHMSLSFWLRDYVYIPLGGNRRGRAAKYLNIAVTFLVSGLWHGGTYKYIFWGLLHCGYQIVGNLTKNGKQKIYNALEMPKGSLPWRLLKTAGTCFWVMLAWIIFRADSLRSGLSMIYSIFTVHNPWIFFDNSLLKLGLDWKQSVVLLLSILVLLAVSLLQTRRGLCNWVLRQHLMIRWLLVFAAIITIWVFGTYGIDYDASAFIYSDF